MINRYFIAGATVLAFGLAACLHDDDKDKDVKTQPPNTEQVQTSEIGNVERKGNILDEEHTKKDIEISDIQEKIPQTTREEIITGMRQKTLEQRLESFPKELSKNSQYVEADGTPDYAKCIASIQNDKFGFAYNVNDLVRLRKNNIECDKAQILGNDIVDENDTPFFMSGDYIMGYIEQQRGENKSISADKLIEEARAYSAIKDVNGKTIFLGGQYLPIFVWASGTVEMAKELSKEVDNNGNPKYGSREMVLYLKPNIEKLKESWAWF